MASLCVLAVVLLCPATAGAGRGSSGLPDVSLTWGGHLRAIGSAAWTEGDVDEPVMKADSDPYWDGQLEWRLKNRMDAGPRWSLETHYELVAVGGDAYQNARHLGGLPPALAAFLAPGRPVGDDRNLFDLTHVISEKERRLVYHRLDRLALTHTADWGTARLGRQALTWGDGLIFNPMDLFNPFAPTAVARDYKAGVDMACLQLPRGEAELQLLYVPRRDPQSGDLEEEEASYAAKHRTPVGALETNVMAARHYGDAVAGLGVSGYWGGAAWRADTVFTHLSTDDEGDDFFQVVANLDYAWVWAGKNVYGLAEFFYNGPGRTGDYAKALADPRLTERLARGELFTIGRYYLSGRLQVELHPLVQLHATAIVNLSDPSGVLQPQVQWDVTQNLQAIAGAQWQWGGGGSEFGGYEVPAGGGVTVAPPDRVYFWLTYYY